MIGQYVLVEQAQEVDRFEVLASAVDVRPPFILAVVVRYSMDATASTRRPSMWNFSIQNIADENSRFRVEVLP